MNKILLNLANALLNLEPAAAKHIYRLAGRYDKTPYYQAPTSQPAFKYIMYLKLIHGLDDTSFHYMKRKYLNTSKDIQEECRKELEKLINADALSSGISSAEISKEFYNKLSKYPVANLLES